MTARPPRMIRPLGLALGLALAGLALAGPHPARAAATTATGARADTRGVDVGALAAEVMAKGAKMRGRLRALFLDAGPDPDAIAALARAIIGALKGDPAFVTDAATLIADAASEALRAPRIYRTALDPAFALGPGAIGWDFGPATSPLYPGFRRVTPAGLVSGDVPLASYDWGRGDGLSSDGIFNVRTFGARVPDGSYRLIVLTGLPDGPGPRDARLGRAFGVNGTILPVANPEPERWFAGARLTKPGGSALGLLDEKPVAAAMVAYVEVSDRRLFVDLAPDGERVYVAGLILEPADAPSALALDAPPPDPEAIMLAEAQVAEAIGGLLETVATAAGEPAVRARIFDLADAPVEDVVTVSPN